MKTIKQFIYEKLNRTKIVKEQPSQYFKINKFNNRTEAEITIDKNKKLWETKALRQMVDYLRIEAGTINTDVNIIAQNRTNYSAYKFDGFENGVLYFKNSSTSKYDFMDVYNAINDINQEYVKIKFTDYTHKPTQMPGMNTITAYKTNEGFLRIGFEKI